MNTQEKELLQEFKNLSQKISNVNSFSGLMMYQSDIQRLYEDFIFFKKLHESKENLAIASSFTPQENSQSISKPKEISTNPVKEVTKESTQSNKEEAPNKAEKLIKQEDSATPNNGQLDYNFSINTGAKPKPIQLDVNDSIAFTNYLFSGDKDEFSTFIEQLNARNKQTSQSLLTHTAEVENWGKKQQEYVDRLKELNNHRFE